MTHSTLGFRQSRSLLGHRRRKSPGHTPHQDLHSTSDTRNLNAIKTKEFSPATVDLGRLRTLARLETRLEERLSSRKQFLKTKDKKHSTLAPQVPRFSPAEPVFHQLHPELASFSSWAASSPTDTVFLIVCPVPFESLQGIMETLRNRSASIVELVSTHCFLGILHDPCDDTLIFSTESDLQQSGPDISLNHFVRGPFSPWPIMWRD